MRALIAGMMVVLCSVVPLSQPSRALAAGTTTTESIAIAPGVVYSTASSSTSNGPVALDILEVDGAQSGIHFETTMALDKVTARELPTLQGALISSEGHRVVATINGSTYGKWADEMFAAHGLNVRDGELITAGFPRGGDNLVSFAITAEGQTLIGAPRLNITLTLPDGTSAAIERFNQPRQPNEASLFSPQFDSTTRMDPSGLELVLTGIGGPIATSGTYHAVVGEVRAAMEAAAFAPGTVVVSADGSAVERFSGLAEGDEVSLRMTIDDPWQNVMWSVGGRELLLQDGHVNIFPTDGKTFDEAAPRTLIGTTPTGKVLLVVADGRRTDSLGLTIPEAAELLRDMGATYAVNLDGGGSSMMAVQHPGNVGTTIVNSPSDGHERKVPNALHIVSSLPAVVVPPGVPTGLMAVAARNFVIQLSWQPSISVTAGTKYRVFRNGRAIGKKQTGLEFVDKRKRSKWFTYQVRAIDAFGRKSLLSAPVRIKARASP